MLKYEFLKNRLPLKIEIFTKYILNIEHSIINNYYNMLYNTYKIILKRNQAFKTNI